MTISDTNVIKSLVIILYFYYQVDNENPSQEHFKHS